MKSAKQIVCILIGAAMILLSVVLIFTKKSWAASNDAKSGESGTVVFEEPVKSLVLEAGACNFEVVIGEEEVYQLDYEGLKYGNLSHRLENGELKISFKQNNNWPAKMFLEKDINDQKITLIVPENAILDSALLEFGAAEIKMERLVANELYITVGAGELQADSLTAIESAKFNVGAGTFFAEDVTLNDAELVCGVGEMELSGLITGESTVDCGVGSMQLMLDGKQENYYGELNCGLGELEFGAINIDGSGKKSYGTSSADRRMDIKCGIGEVDVRFYN